MCSRHEYCHPEEPKRFCEAGPAERVSGLQAPGHVHSRRTGHSLDQTCMEYYSQGCSDSLV